MDISRWPMDRILQLPDHCLSRRYSVFCCLRNPAETNAWDISELALPNQAIIHEVGIFSPSSFGELGDIRMALGDQLPTTIAQMDGLEPLFSGMGLQGPGPRRIPTAAGMQIRLNRLKMFVPAQGRRLVLELVTEAGKTQSVLVGVVVSSVPTEVPDWVVSV